MRKLVTFVVIFCLFIISPAFARIDNGDTSDTRDRLIGDTTCPWGELDCNPCVDDVIGNFENISDNQDVHTKLRIESRDDEGELMSAKTDNQDLTVENCWWGEAWHIQGIGRIPNVGDNNWVVFTRSVDGEPGAFFIGELGDVVSAGGHWESLEDQNDDEREINAYYVMSEFDPVDGHSNHYGGLQMLGQLLFTGTECFENEWCDSDHLPDVHDMVYIYDLSDPLNVTLVSSIVLYSVGASVAATKLYNGHYLVIASGSPYTFYFYISEQDTLSVDTTWSLRETWAGSELIDGEGSNNIGDYQNINLVTECDTNRLYLIATHQTNDCTGFAEDWADLFLVEEDSDSNVMITKIQEVNKHIYCNWCNLAASGNIYITPERNMVLYASDKDDNRESGGDITFEEFQNALNECNGETDGTCDYEGDGLTNREEDTYGTSRYEADTDGDSLNDYDEVYTYETDPLDADSDDDGLSDGNEVIVYGTNPLDTDSDDDGLGDGEEVNTYSTDPLNADTDGDGLNDQDEVYTYDTDPLDADSDDDGLEDGEEINTYSTNPNNTDSDNDGLEDGDEVNTYFTNPLNTDTDGDHFSDYEEVQNGGNPLDGSDKAKKVLPIIHSLLLHRQVITDADGDGYDTLSQGGDDCDDTSLAIYPDAVEICDGVDNNCDDVIDDICDNDGDGLLNSDEWVLGSDPEDADSDDDGLEDGEEVNTYSTDPLDSDSDNDHFSDAEEIQNGEDPLDGSDKAKIILPIINSLLLGNRSVTDTDGDGLHDTDEVAEGSDPNDPLSVACVTPSTEADWTITSNCTFFSSKTWSGDLYVQDSAVMTIPSGISLDLDLSQKKLVIQSGSGVLIEQGGSLE